MTHRTERRTDMSYCLQVFRDGWWHSISEGAIDDVERHRDQLLRLWRKPHARLRVVAFQVLWEEASAGSEIVISGRVLSVDHVMVDASSIRESIESAMRGTHECIPVDDRDYERETVLVRPLGGGPKIPGTHSAGCVVEVDPRELSVRGDLRHRTRQTETLLQRYGAVELSHRRFKVDVLSMDMALVKRAIIAAIEISAASLAPE